MQRQTLWSRTRNRLRWQQIGEWLFLLIYRLVWWVALPWVLARLWIRGRNNPAYRRNIKQRLGYYENISVQKGCWCLHAVSVGENVAASSLVNLWLQHFSEHQVVITCMTPTGADQIAKLYGNQVIQLYLPYDLPSMVNRFLDHFKPAMLVIMETEIWPVLIREANRRAIPIFLVNGRLSDHSFSGYCYVKWLVRQWLNRFTLVMVQSQQDLERFAEIGVQSKRLLLTGNLKFDLSVTSAQRQQAEGLRTIWGKRPVLIAASTHLGEDEIVLQAVQKIWRSYPELLLVVAPRHPENFDRVAKMFSERLGSRAVVRYSDLSRYSDTDTKVVVADVMGRLMALYGASDLVLVGGSLLPFGGHNLLEPAAWQKPLLSGCHLNNFIEIRDKLLRHKGLLVVNNGNELAEQLSFLLDNPATAEQLGVNGYRVVCINRGTTNRVMEQLVQYVNS